MEMTNAAVNCSVRWRMSSMFTVTLLKEFFGYFKEVLDVNLSVVLVQYCHDLSKEMNAETV